MMAEIDLHTMIDAFRAFVRSKGWSVVAEKEIAYGYQLVVTDGINKTPVDLFKSGKTLIQGKPSALQAELRSWYQVSPTATAATGVGRIGLDESGKGDYFGPLVIGAVYVDGLTEAQLITLGVRDSKLLSDHRVLTMAEAVKGTCPHFVVSIGPKTYNEMYERMQNLNQLLAWGHAQSLEKVLGKVSCNLAIADQFGDESYLLNALGEKGRLIKLEQRPHAESDVAVAAASILARAEFVRRMEQLSNRAGKTLPKGAFDPSIITIGREIVAKGGQSALAEVAKLHFKTTQTVLQS
jgi:ribonuclease HIII